MMAPVRMGVVLRDLDTYRTLVHTIVDDKAISETEFTYRAPLYKATDKLCERLKGGLPSGEKFDAYFEETILNVAVREQMRQAFEDDFVRRYPRSERTDLFLKSGEVLTVSFTISVNFLRERWDSIWPKLVSHPADPDVLQHLEVEGTVEREHVTGTMRIFLDDVYNQRRRVEPSVQAVMTGSRRANPVVAEVFTNGALPGVFLEILGPIIDEVDGALVILSG